MSVFIFAAFAVTTVLRATPGGCDSGMAPLAVTNTIIGAINTGNFNTFKSCIAPEASAHEPGRDFNGRDKLLAWARDEIFDSQGRLTVVKTNSIGGKEYRCGRFATPNFGFKVKYVFQAKNGLLTRWDLHYWKTSNCP